MHNQTKTILALLVLTALTAVAYAQTYQPTALDVIIQINDARAAAGFGPGYNLCDPWGPWDFGLKDYPPYEFAAGKSFMLIIREIASNRQYGDAFRDFKVSAVANGTGFVKFDIKISADVDVTKRSDWYIAIVVEWEPESGRRYHFLVYNLTLRGATLIDVVGNLSGRVERSGTEINDRSRLGVIRITHGPGRFGNLSSSAIHTFYVGVNTLGKPFDLSFRRTVTIAGATIILDRNKRPEREPTEYVRRIDSRVTSVFGPFTYLGAYVTSLGRAGTDRRDYEVSVDETRVRYDHEVYITGGLIIESRNDIRKTFDRLTYVAITRNKTEGPGTGVMAPMSCGLVIWNMTRTMSTVTITGLLDLKGNPILNPEHFWFKIQMKVGDNWVTYDRAQGSWKLSIPDVAAAILNAIERARRGEMVEFRQLVLDLYDTVTLTRFGGRLRLTNDEPRVSAADLTTKLVVEYSYTAGQDIVKATVLEVALAEPANFEGVLNVSVLPVQIRLWRWSNKTLPPSVANPREYFYTNPLDLASLRFVVEGDAMYVNRMAYDGAISYDPWLGQVVWTLPPYQPVPGLVGNVRATLLVWLNASGYLPMPPLVANLTRGGKIQYFNYTDAAAKAGFFRQFMIGVVSSYSYKFRIYRGDALVGTANVVAYYPVINASGFVQNAYTPSSEVRPNATGRIITSTSQRWRIEGDSYVLTQSGGICQVVIWGSGRIINVTGGGRTIFSTNYAIVVRVNSTTACSGDEVVITLGAGQRAEINYTVYESLRDVLEEVYSGTKRNDMYAVQVVKPRGFFDRLFDREHVIHIAIAWVSQNILLRDACGSPIVGVGAGANITLVMNIDGKNITIASLPVGSEVSVDIMVPIDDWGNMKYDLRGGENIRAYAVLNYFGYKLYPVDNLTKIPAKGPVWFDITFKSDGARKPVLYLPIAPLNFRVWSTVKSVDYTIPKKEPLVGFVVRVFNATGRVEIARSVSNKDGYAYVPNVPIGDPIRVVVRTIVPGEDKRWPYTFEQRNRNNDYVSYVNFMTGSRDDTKDVYTLGTRGRIDSGLVVLNITRTLTESNATKYICAEDAIDLEVEVYDIEVMVFDKTGQYLLKSQPVFLGPYPGATRPFLLNVTLVLADDYSPYDGASRWSEGSRRDFIVLTDFRAIGVTGMRGIYHNLARKYLEDAQTAFGCRGAAHINYSRVANSYVLAAMAGFVANASTDRYEAVYRINSQQPKDRVDPCRMTPSQAGVAEIARLFMKGQRFRFVVWYMGQKVFDDYVTIDAPRVNIRANVYPINITAFTKSMRLPVDAFVGFTLTDVYVGLALKPDTRMLANRSLVPQLIQPFASVYRTYSLAYLLENELAKGTSELYNVIVNATVGNNREPPQYYGRYRSVVNGSDFVYLPNIVVIRNATTPKYLFTYLNKSAVPRGEYAVSYDYWWFRVAYDPNLGRYGVLYNVTGVVKRTDMLWVLSHTGAERCADLRDRRGDAYIYELVLTGYNFTNFRTLMLVLPWKTDGRGEVTVKITAFNATGGREVRLDSRTYNVADLVGGARGAEVVVTLPLNFDNITRYAYDIVSKRQTIKYRIEIEMKDPRRAPIRVCAITLVPLAANYSTVDVYQCEGGRPVRERVYDINLPLSLRHGFGQTYDVYGGFGTPITYVVKPDEEVALLPSWYNKTAVAGSRIARVWIIAANEDPAKGPALGTKYSVSTVKGDNVRINVYRFERYLVVNFVPNVCPAGRPTTRTFLDEFDGEGRIVGLGFGTSGTSTLVLSKVTGVPMWNSTAMWLEGIKKNNVAQFKLRTVALDRLTVHNNATFPILVYSLTVKYGDDKYSIPMSQLRVDSRTTSTMLLDSYGFGRTYMFSIAGVWNVTLVQPRYEYGLNAYHAGLNDAAKHFGLGEVDVSKYLKPLESKYFEQNVLYASHAKTSRWTYRILNGKITEITNGTWGRLDVTSNDTDYKYVFSFPTLPLREIRDWNDRPLANQTIALFDRRGRLYAIVHSDSRGRLPYLLPDISNISETNVVRVAWYNGYLMELLSNRSEFTLWIYDQLIKRDVEELGNASATSKIRTYVYPLAATVRDITGRPLTNMWVRVIDEGTRGSLVNAVNKTGADGTTRVFDPRISTYPSGFISQVPATGYLYYVYDETGMLVATGTYSIQRGGAVPAAGWNIDAVVIYATDIPVKNSGTRGYLLIRGVEFLNGTKKDEGVKIPFTVSGGVMTLGGKVPVSVEYPVEIYVTHVTLGGQEVPVKGGQYLVFRGKTTDLLAGLDFAELGLTGVVTVQAVDATGAPRADWTVQVMYGGITAVQDAGQIQAVLPRTDVLERPYNIRIITNAVTPDGKALVKEQTLELKQKALALQIPVSTVKVTIQAIDGFGAVRSDFPVVVENVASGMGQVATELVEGQQYVARVTGLGFTNATTFTARGPQMVIRVKIPTAKIVAQVVDGFGKVRGDWSVQIVGVSSGQGTVGPVEVLGGQQYTVKTSVFGREFSQTVNVPVGQTVTATVHVPTARLSVTAVDDDRKPIDNYVSSVELTGPLNLMYSTPPKDVEVLAGTYSIKITALGKEAPPAQVTLNPGETRNIQIVVPGTAGLDFMGARIPLPTLVLYAVLLLVITLILAILIIEYNNWRRRRLMQILAPPK